MLAGRACLVVSKASKINSNLINNINFLTHREVGQPGYFTLEDSNMARTKTFVCLGLFLSVFWIGNVLG